MDFRFTPEEEALREEVRLLVREELSPGWQGFMFGEEYGPEEGWTSARKMARRLAEKGWLTMAWPREYGGRGASPMEWHVYREEVAYFRVPGIDMGIGGVPWIGPSLMLFGTEEQKREHLPRIARGETFWCTGYSEPGAGSDLASLELQAREEGDDFVLSGQKVWTTAGHRADWCWLAVRTDPQAPKHKGISLLLVDMKTPGITARPLLNMTGESGFSEIFFDGVRVPRRNLVGEKNRGWYHLVVSLDFERTIGITAVAFARRLLDDLIGYAEETKTLWRNPVLRHRLAELAIEGQVGRLVCYRVAGMEGRGQLLGYEASMAKNFGTELLQRVANAGMQLLGLYGQLGLGKAPLGGWARYAYLSGVGMTIAGGTSEINRNIMALRGLGLPRG